MGVRVGIAGLGTVGGSVYKTLLERADEIKRRTGENFRVSKVINRSTEKYERLCIPKEKIAHDFEDLIVNCDVVVETIGGTSAALELVEKALQMRKIVVTANKELISKHGNDLLKLVRTNNTEIYFEAAVGGGIPIIALLQNYLIFQRVRRIRGILNGTTNFILTKLVEGWTFEDALREAQRLGYAEADPSSDVTGLDAAYKASVLWGVVTGEFPSVSTIPTVGIETLKKEKIDEVAKDGQKIKLLAELDFESSTIRVEPKIVTKSDRLWSVDGVENAVVVETDLAGDFFLQGRGAGGFPTATAVIADLFRVSRYMRYRMGRRDPVVVMKFGGTSINTAERIRAVAQKIAKRKREGIHPVVVVSAMGDTTDKLIEMAKNVSDRPDPRELDMLLSTGEQQSMALLAMALHQLGEKAASLTGAQVRIVTDENHSQARILEVRTEALQRRINTGWIPIVAGFQGISHRGEITTLGRGGSDTSAVALAHALGVEICEIHTDVDGVYTADPKIVPDARPLKEITWDEMIELAGSGAGVLQARSVEFARKYGVRLLVKNAHSEARGTLVWEGRNMEGPIVRAVTHDKNVVKVVFRRVPDRPGIAARIFRALSEEGVKTDMIIQSMFTGNVNDISFIVPSQDAGKVNFETIGKRCEAQEVVVDDNVAKVSLVGVNVTSSTEIPATLFETLANEGINIDMISTSNSRISVIIAKDAAERAVKAIHARFKLGEA